MTAEEAAVNQVIAQKLEVPEADFLHDETASAALRDYMLQFGAITFSRTGTLYLPYTTRLPICVQSSDCKAALVSIFLQLAGVRETVQ